jgi:tetratricopeptide (TPR) repeat protein
MSNAAVKKSRKVPVAGQSTPWRRLTQFAFLLSLVLVIVRMTTQEFLRPESLPAPGSASVPAVAGPATSFLLDLLCCLPALLVLARRIVDRGYNLKFAWSHLAMLLLGAWTLTSILWASDKFAAAMNASHWAVALVLLWSSSQLVRGWVEFRLVTAVAFGLLMVLLVQGYYYRFLDLPDMQREWHAHQTEWLAQRGTDANSTEATQLGKNIASGDVTGFSLSRNTYAAVLVLLIVVSAGIMMQRFRDGDDIRLIIPIAVVVLFALLMMYAWVKSKTSVATPIIGAALLILIWKRKDILAQHARQLYWGGVAFFMLMVAAVVGHGIVHGTLVHVSLTFRWWYWVGAARLFVHHPWIGVGWANFGSHYLAYRLPQAAEEPNDPHNFLVRAFVELGVVGGLLTIAWILRLWWELGTFPMAGQSEEPIRRPALPFLLGLALAAIGLNCIFSIDWSAQTAWIIIELFKRLLFLLALLTGICVAGIRSFNRQEMDDRPAPWLHAAVLVGLGLFLLHNLIDFSMFEIGPMYLFVLLAGSALGVRLPGRPALRFGKSGAVVAFILSAIGWVVTAGGVLIPITEAEELAQDADHEVRTAREPDASTQTPPNSANLQRAEEDYLKAFRLVPINADYAFRAEQSAILRRGSPILMRQLIDEAQAADPSSVRYRLARAVLKTSEGDLSGAATDYEQILRLDPNNLEIRLQFAALLDKQGRSREAREQYQKVLEFNNKLAADEIRRLSKDQLDQIRKRIS